VHSSACTRDPRQYPAPPAVQPCPGAPPAELAAQRPCLEAPLLPRAQETEQQSCAPSRARPRLTAPLSSAPSRRPSPSAPHARAPTPTRPYLSPATTRSSSPPPAATPVLLAPVDPAPSRSTSPEDPHPCCSAPSSAPAVPCRGRPTSSTQLSLLFHARLASPRLPAPACTGRHELYLARRARNCVCPPPRRPSHLGHVRVLRSSLEPYSSGLRRGPPSGGPSRAWTACLPTCCDRLPSG
jgi:hypothetical protein